MLLVSQVCQEHKLIKQVENLCGLRHPTLNSLLSGTISRISRADIYGLNKAVYLTVQYLYEKAERVRRINPHRAMRLIATAHEITRLNNESFTIPFERARLDGPTELIRPKSEAPRHVD